MLTFLTISQATLLFEIVKWIIVYIITFLITIAYLIKGKAVFEHLKTLKFLERVRHITVSWDYAISFFLIMSLSLLSACSFIFFYIWPAELINTYDASFYANKIKMGTSGFVPITIDVTQVANLTQITNQLTNYIAGCSTTCTFLPYNYNYSYYVDIDYSNYPYYTNYTYEMPYGTLSIPDNQGGTVSSNKINTTITKALINISVIDDIRDIITSRGIVNCPTVAGWTIPDMSYKGTLMNSVTQQYILETCVSSIIL